MLVATARQFFSPRFILRRNKVTPTDVVPQQSSKPHSTFQTMLHLLLGGAMLGVPPYLMILYLPKRKSES
uniref:Uncharacterized protein n=1 Tax=Amphimedon queenslandica TaxID=400682 RepID=I1GDF4_AMPQE